MWLWIWTPAERSIFFRGSGPEFHSLYATAQLGRALGRAVPLDDLRAVLDAIAERVPEAAHVTVGYNWNPVVLMGHAGADGGLLKGYHQEGRRVLLPRFGLVVREGSLWLFADSAAVAEFNTNRTASLVAPVTTASIGARSLIERVQVVGGTWAPSQAVQDFLAWASQRLRAGIAHGLTRADLSDAAGMQAAFDHHGLGSVVTPLVVAELRAAGSPAARASIGAGCNDDATPAQKTGTPYDTTMSAVAPEEEGRDQDDNLGAPGDHVGGVYRLHGVTQTLVQTRRPFEDSMRGLVGGGAEFLALVAGGDRPALQAAVSAMAAAENALATPTLRPTLPGGAGDSYVYAYYSNCSRSWGDVFYIGKGTGSRYLDHIAQVLALPPGAAGLTQKEALIRTGLGAIAARTGAAINNIAGYRSAATSGHSLVEPLFLFPVTQFPDGLAEDLAFCAEHYLISSLGAYKVANDTNGNARTPNHGLRLLVRPGAYNAAYGHHRQWWNNACVAFAQCAGPTGPVIPAAEMASLRLMALEPLVTTFDAAVAGDAVLGPRLVPMAAPPGQTASPLTGLSHLYVANGQDATVNYALSSPAAPFRLELTASRKEPGIRINLRPLGRAGTPAMAAHLAARLGPAYGPGFVSNASGDGFFKPFAPLAGGRPDGRADVTFAFSSPYGPAVAPSPGNWPAWHPHGLGAFDIISALREVVGRLG